MRAYEQPPTHAKCYTKKAPYFRNEETKGNLLEHVKDGNIGSEANRYPI